MSRPRSPVSEVGIDAAIIHSACLGVRQSRNPHVLDFGKVLRLADIAVLRDVHSH